MEWGEASMLLLREGGNVGGGVCGKQCVVRVRVIGIYNGTASFGSPGVGQAYGPTQ